MEIEEALIAADHVATYEAPTRGERAAVVLAAEVRRQRSVQRVFDAMPDESEF